MKKILYILLTTLFLISFVACTTETVSDARQEKVLPRIYPDYLGVTIPVNIAPLNFCMEDETALRIDAVIADRHGRSLHSQGEESVDFDIDDWHQLLSQNRGDSLTITVSAKYDDGWHTYRSFPVYVSRSMSVLTASTTVSATVLSHRVTKCGARWGFMNATSPLSTSVR